MDLPLRPLPFATPSRIPAAVRGALAFAAWRPSSTETIGARVRRVARRHPSRVALRFEGRRWTYAEWVDEVDRTAAAWRALGVSAGDVVALRMTTRPGYLAHLFALQALGARPALIAADLGPGPLAHALRACEARWLLADGGAWGGVEEALADAPNVAGRVWLDVEPGRSDVGPPELPRFAAAKHAHGFEPVAARLDTVAAYLFTSGTTGMPKAAPLRHRRFVQGGVGMAGALGITPKDTVYVCLPLNHATGLVLGVCMALGAGATLALGRRFSASRFFDEARAHGATAAVHIGELCRYLLARPPAPTDKAHGVRRMVGNGLRAELWEPFQTRFGVDHIVEFYAATEGNAEAVNLGGPVGSCGLLIPGRMALIRCDPVDGTIARDARGRASRVGPGEPGRLVAKVTARHGFDGYVDVDATERKLLRDVFRQGDVWFDTGDLLSRDRMGWLTFVDRVGDTFRWKGENVATRQVEQQLAAGDGLDDLIVYGVEVPGQEGRAGAVAFVPTGAPDTALAALAARAEGLPDYARPRFALALPAIGRTATFKHQRRALVATGVGPSGEPGPGGQPRPPTWVWAVDGGGAGRFEPLDAAAWGQILTGTRRL